MAKIPYCGQELSTIAYESGGHSPGGDPRPKIKLIPKLVGLMEAEGVPLKRRVLVAGFLLDRCRQEAARAH